MRKVSFFWPLFLSLAIHLGLFVVDFSPIRDRAEVRQIPKSISLKLVTSIKLRQTVSEPVMETKPVAAVKPPQVEAIKPREKISPEPKPKIKIVKEPVTRPEKKAAALKKVPVVRKRAVEPALKPKPIAETAAGVVPSTDPSAIGKTPEPVFPERERDVDPGPTELASVPESSETEEVSVPGRILGSVRPTYPRYSRRHNQEGTVVLKVEISSKGEQINITVISSSGYFRLDREAIRTLERASFAPARLGGREVASTKQITVTFKLEEIGN
ncbi:MAG: energy transducer TonB [Deltaproteobacteria bacterium]|nr:energy transducer TonB [Deltaproteobacteria bacterium]